MIRSTISPKTSPRTSQSESPEHPNKKRRLEQNEPTEGVRTSSQSGPDNTPIAAEEHIAAGYEPETPHDNAPSPFEEAFGRMERMRRETHPSKVFAFMADALLSLIPMAQTGPEIDRAISIISPEMLQERPELLLVLAQQLPHACGAEPECLLHALRFCLRHVKPTNDAPHPNAEATLLRLIDGIHHIDPTNAKPCLVLLVEHIDASGSDSDSVVAALHQAMVHVVGRTPEPSASSNPVNPVTTGIPLALIAKALDPVGASSLQSSQPDEHTRFLITGHARTLTNLSLVQRNWYVTLRPELKLAFRAYYAVLAQISPEPLSLTQGYQGAFLALGADKMSLRMVMEHMLLTQARASQIQSTLSRYFYRVSPQQAHEAAHTILTTLPAIWSAVSDEECRSLQSMPNMLLCLAYRMGVDPNDELFDNLLDDVFNCLVLLDQEHQGPLLLNLAMLLSPQRDERLEGVLASLQRRNDPMARDIVKWRHMLEHGVTGMPHGEVDAALKALLGSPSPLGPGYTLLLEVLSRPPRARHREDALQWGLTRLLKEYAYSVPRGHPFPSSHVYSLFPAELLERCVKELSSSAICRLLDHVSADETTIRLAFQLALRHKRYEPPIGLEELRSMDVSESSEAVREQLSHIISTMTQDM